MVSHVDLITKAARLGGLARFVDAVGNGGSDGRYWLPLQ